jgi:UDP-N-acetylglucosamine 1-carboxyvinyltransferase
MNLKIKGGQVLSGEITPSGSKNSIVALIPATLLFEKPVTLTNVPDVTDVQKLVSILQGLGSKIVWEREKNTLLIDNSQASPKNLTQTSAANIRGTSLLWGPLLGRFKQVYFDSLPGGCTLGRRPLDAHFKALSDLGVEIETDSSSRIKMTAEKARAAKIWLSEMSPTATENILVLALTLPGTTVITGAASEPQVQDLCRFFISAGAQIEGIGSNMLTVKGGLPLHPVTHDVLPDHVEIATFLALGAATGGKIKVNNSPAELFPAIDHEFFKMGIVVEHQGNTACVEANQIKTDKIPHQDHPIIIRAQPWPALPVDLLPVFIALSLAVRDGHQFLFHNWMYEAGLFWTSELLKFGANVTMCDPHRVLITSGNPLKGATIEAPYIIRATVALATVAMIAQGESTVLNADTLYRGHANFSENLRALGAIIEEA